MKYSFFTFLLLLLGFRALAQSSDTWTAFSNKDTTRIGFKDSHGVVKIEPKFAGFTNAQKFEYIIAVTEDSNGRWKSYYLTKSGRIVGRDSLYIFDNSTDCESEGFIRFKDKHNDKVGMFNRQGDVAIPAAYDYLLSVRNGMIIALKGARKEVNGEYHSWVGGQEILIDTSNHTLIEDFKYDKNLNFFSLLVSVEPHPDTIRRNFKTVNGTYFSFIDFEKEFRAWLKSSLLTNFTRDRLANATYKEVTFWQEPAGWISKTKDRFIDKNFALMKAKLLQLNAKSCVFDVFNEGLNPFIYSSEEYSHFFNTCGESKDWLYPIQSVVISYPYKKDVVQDHFDFLRTDTGYKLISVSIKRGKIK